MRIKKYYISLILLLLTATTASSVTTADIDKEQEKERTEMRIYFRVNSNFSRPNTILYCCYTTAFGEIFQKFLLSEY